jgi:hypothetical protein
MDIITGVDVREFLQSQPLTPELSAKLIDMLVIFKQIGFERIDHHKRQIFIQPDGNLKVIDVARTVWRDRVYPYPRKLLTSLGEENKAIFLTHVQEMAPELYQEWIHYIRMEEISQQIIQVLLPQKPDKDKVKKLSKQLLTTNDEEQYVLQLHGLVQKVFKEEWVKTMLARGKDPESVMEKIDEYWKSQEQHYLRDADRNLFRRFSESPNDLEKHRHKKHFEGEKHHHKKYSEGDKHHHKKHFEGDKSHDHHHRNHKGAHKKKRRHS